MTAFVPAHHSPPQAASAAAPGPTADPIRLRLLLSALLLFAFASRVFWLNELPPGLNRDESFYGVDALSVLTQGPRPFYAGNGGREGLFMLLAAPSLAVLGREPLALRLPAAFAGVLFLASVWALGRRLFRTEPSREGIALAATAFAASSLWLIVENRLGWRINLLAPLLAIAAYWFWRALETGSVHAWAAAGFTCGLAQYSYSSARLLPLLVPGTAIVLPLLLRRSVPFPGWRQWLAFLLPALLVVLPLAFYAISNPASFLERAVVLATNDGRLANQQGYLARLGGVLRSFISEGASQPWQSVPGMPAFPPPLAVLFLLGLVLASRRVRQPAFCFLLLWFVLFTLAAAIPRDATPHFLHTSGVLPVLFFFPALGLGALIQGAAAWLRIAWLAPAAIGAVALASCGWAWQVYFEGYRQLPELAASFDSDLVEVANALNDRAHPASAIVIPIGSPYPPGWSHPTIDFLYRGSAPLRFLRVDETTIAPELAALLGARQQVIVLELRPQRLTPPDNRGLLDFLLRRQGELVTEERQPSYHLRVYQLHSPLSPALTPVPEQAAGQRWGEVLQLASWAAGSTPVSGRGWVLARWSLQELLSQNLKASLRLRDSAGQLVAQDDRDLLLPPHFAPTSAWPAGSTAASYHLLDLPIGLPPGTYTLSALVYDRDSTRPLSGGEQPIGTITLDPPTRPLPEELRLSGRSWPGVALVGYHLPTPSVRPGEPLVLVLYWQRTAEPLTATTATVRLLDRMGSELGRWQGIPLAAEYPPAHWPAGALVRQVLTLPVAARAASGPFRVDVRWGEGLDVPVAEGEVRGRERLFTPPAVAHVVDRPLGDFAQLLGWTATRRGTDVLVELVWQARATPTRNWTVFVHLLDEQGHIVSQQDAPPAAGDAPTSSWLAGEVVVDRKQLRAPAGPVRLVVGMYDPATGERLGSELADSLELGWLP
ncbi:MAG: hypothetical protein KatS3mg061_0211 [Dehalococcoidia bacterium]|nr:MAG: hypothetical protein KatS3mg061_0211 [Dehalococcoidia bacterium]